MDPISIQGMGAITALGRTAPELQSGLLEGRRAIRRPDWVEWDPHYPVAEVDLVTDLEEDRSRLLAEHAAREAIAEAGWSKAELTSERTLVVVGSTKAGLNVAERILETRTQPSQLDQSFLFSLAPQFARTFGIRGPVQTVSLACASGLVALGYARRAIARGDVDRALVVGTDAMCRFIYVGFASLQALDPNGARPFDGTRAGLTAGEGAAVVALGRGGGKIEVAGYGASNDANHITGPARDGRGLVKAVQDSLTDASVAPDQVGFGLLHGTGTKFNDLMESIAYRTVFGAGNIPALSIKGSIGHLMGGAGLANLVVTARALEDGRLPFCVGYETPDPDIDLDIVAGAPRDVDTDVAVTSASGFAGVNAAALVRRRRTPPSVPATPRDPIEVVVTAQVDLPADRDWAKEQIGKRSARRLDDLNIFGVAAANATFEQAGLTKEAIGAESHGLVLGTGLGCLETDYTFFLNFLEGQSEDASPRRFAYSLPNIALGEVAIRNFLMGENLVFSAGRASGLTALAEAAGRIADGSWTRALVLTLEVVGDGCARFGVEEAVKGQVSGWMLEARPAAQARGAKMMGAISGRVWGTPVGALQDAATGDVEDGERLGATGLLRVAAAVREARPTTVTVECPSGYGAEVEVRAPEASTD